MSPLDSNWVWCTKLCPGPSRSHKRELKVQAPSGAHWNPHIKLYFDFGGTARMRAIMRAGGRLSLPSTRSRRPPWCL